MQHRDQIVVTLTTWSARISNIPSVLDSIYSQTMLPDVVVLNLAFNEIIPSDVETYLNVHHVEVNRVKDTKVYKKLLPTLRRYPEACIISIDDDFIYPRGMIEEFMTIHKKHPHSPITGNRLVFHHLNCHCGCASLTKREFFGDSFDNIDEEVMANCPADDIVYTYFCSREGYYYVRTKNVYFLNMMKYRDVSPFSKSISNYNEAYYLYLERKFGKLPRTNLIGYAFMVIQRRICAFLEYMHNLLHLL